jgi:hypothetical protein
MLKTMTFQHTSRAADKPSFGLIGSIEVEVDGDWPVIRIDDTQVSGVEYLFFYGLRQTLQDSYAQAPSRAKAVEKWEKKLEAVIADTVRSRTPSTQDEVEKEMRNIALTNVKAAIQAAGNAVSKFTTKQMNVFVARYIKLNLEPLFKLACERVEGRKSLNLDTSFADLLSDKPAEKPAEKQEESGEKQEEKPAEQPAPSKKKPGKAA